MNSSLNHFLRSLFAMLLGASSVAELQPSLKEVAAPHFLMGVGIRDRIPAHPEDWPLLLQHFAVVTPENSLKPDPLQTVQGQYRFDTPDAFVNFAEQQNLRIVGHTLVWAKDDRTPPWFFEKDGHPASREIVLARMEEHIRTTVSRYKGRIASWDVVNEALSDGSGYLRDSGWTRTCGEEFISRAFEVAHATDPDAQLIYNDYNNELDGKREKMIQLIEWMRLKNVPLHAVGLQGHYEIDRVPFDQLRTTLEAMRKLRMKVVISELDIDVIPRGRWWADNGAHRNELRTLNPYADGCPPDILRRQAEQYAALFSLFREYSDIIERVSFWNLHDGESWLNSFPWKRDNHPLLFDRHRQPKPAFSAVIEALR